MQPQGVAFVEQMKNALAGMRTNSTKAIKKAIVKKYDYFFVHFCNIIKY